MGQAYSLKGLAARLAVARPLEDLLEAFTRAKRRHFRGGDTHFLLGLGVNAFPSLLFADVELPEAGDLDLLPTSKRSGYDLLEALHVPLGFSLGRIGPLGYLLDQLGLVHALTLLPSQRSR